MTFNSKTKKMIPKKSYKLFLMNNYYNKYRGKLINCRILITSVKAEA